jgi:hypothetical protein
VANKGVREFFGSGQVVVGEYLPPGNPCFLRPLNSAEGPYFPSTPEPLLIEGNTPVPLGEMELGIAYKRNCRRLVQARAINEAISELPMQSYWVHEFGG